MSKKRGRNERVQTPDWRRLIDWIKAALSSTATEKEEVSAVAVDLSDIFDSAQALTKLFQRALMTAATADHLETLAIEVQTHVEHVVRHWESLMSQESFSWLRDSAASPEDSG